MIEKKKAKEGKIFSQFERLFNWGKSLKSCIEK